MQKPALKLGYTTQKAAKLACERWHYSGSLPVGKLVRIGVWENGMFIGVVLFSRGPRNVGKPFCVDQNDICELARVALTAHRSPVSKIVKVALSLLKRTSPKLKLVVSYADPAQGHHGGIYQAGNWFYVGDTAQSRAYMKDGRRYHQRVISVSGKNKQMGRYAATLKPSDCDAVIQLPGKHRYVIPLTKQMRLQLQSMSKPYPSRTKLGNDCDQQNSGGATPTSALQSEAAA